MTAKPGGSTGMNPRVPDVWTIPCPTTNLLATHWPVQTEHKGIVVTRCKHCYETWTALDEAARRS